MPVSCFIEITSTIVQSDSLRNVEETNAVFDLSYEIYAFKCPYYFATDLVLSE